MITRLRALALLIFAAIARPFCRDDEGDDE